LARELENPLRHARKSALSERSRCRASPSPSRASAAARFLSAARRCRTRRGSSSRRPPTTARGCTNLFLRSRRPSRRDRPEITRPATRTALRRRRSQRLDGPRPQRQDRRPHGRRRLGQRGHPGLTPSQSWLGDAALGGPGRKNAQCVMGSGARFGGSGSSAAARDHPDWPRYRNPASARRRSDAGSAWYLDWSR